MKEFIMILFILLTLFNIAIIVFKRKIISYFRKCLNETDLKQIVNLNELQNEETPKSLSGMESIALPTIQKDFPNLNINELKSIAESIIVEYFDALENKKYKEIENISDNVKVFITSKIEDLKDKDVNYDDIKIHRTIINRYENKNGVATIYFQTALEYKYKEKSDEYRKIQDRYEIEFIYIIDETKVDKITKSIGLNCPNCGAPIGKIGIKECEYCGSIVTEVVNRVWILNSIRQK